MKKCILCVVLIFFLGSTYTYSQKVTSTGIKQYQRIFQPDSILTQSELKLKYKLYDLIVNQILFDGKKVYTNLKVSDFKKNDIPLFYYGEFVKSLNDINVFFANNKHCNSDDLQNALLELRKQYKIAREAKSDK